MKSLSISKTIPLAGHAGFTLVELMAAMVITAVGLFAVLQLQLVSIRANSYAQERTGAQEIANGVADELETMALQWIDNRVGADPAFPAIFNGGLNSNNLITTLIELSAPPNNMGDPIPAGSLRALTTYHGKAIAADGSPGAAQLINTNGCSPLSAADADCANYGGKGLLYRVHYVAHYVVLRHDSPQADQNVVRMTVFVSWDNKDLGSPVDYNNWLNSFWDRHMVAVTFFLARNRLW